jgi:hypothetical protein
MAPAPVPRAYLSHTSIRFALPNRNRNNWNKAGYPTPATLIPGLRDRTLRGMDQHLVEELLEVRISFVGRVVREYVEQASLKIT